ncbi:MAG: DUF721 domain-containing protein [Bacteroidota bacterium]
MGSYSMAEALNLLMERSKWKPKVIELRLRDEWETITSKTVAKYTRKLYLSGKVLTIYTDVAPLKQELLHSKNQLIETINKYFEENVVNEIQVK